MPVERVADTDLEYYLIAYDEEGRERTDDPGGRMSQRAAEAAGAGVTDVFVLSHGWQGAVPEARDQYSRWLRAALRCEDDRRRLRERPGGFRPLVIGLHWPSLPWGDEEFGMEAVSFGGGTAVPALVERYAERVADTAPARQALATILGAAQRDPNPDTLPAEVRTAYTVLDHEAHLGSGGTGDEPGSDREPFDPERRFREARDEAVAFGGGGFLDGLLSPLRQLSFWKMKDRARRFGEGGAHDLVAALQEAAPDARLHLAGHSFGSIVVSAATTGPRGGSGLPRPVHSLVLVQGALSLWSYCSSIPSRKKRAGYFRPLVDGQRVAGPVVTTRSRFDTAVGRWYPLGAGAARQYDLAPGDLPRYGGVGTFGLQGPGLDLVQQDMGPVEQRYEFAAGRVYNLEGSGFIKQGGGSSGAHSDIDNPEVGHVVWEAALTPT